MKNYPTYKSSGVSWIGDVPSHWILRKIKYNTYVKARVGWHGLNSSEFYFGDDGAFCITGTDFGDGKINWKSCYKVPENRYDEDPYIQLRENDLLLTKDGTIGKVAVVKNLSGKATLNSGVFVVRPLHEEYTSDFLFWLISSTLFQGFVDYTSKGSTIIHLYQDTFVNWLIPIPPQSEQQSISKFLDTKTSEIDNHIRNKQKLIELLKEERAAIINHAVTKGIDPNVKMKDSGVEWLGEIAEAWNYIAVKHLVEIKVTDGPHETPEFLEIGIPFASAESVVNGKIDFDRLRGYISEEDHERYSLKCKPQCGDVFIVKSGSTTGKVAYVDFDKEFNIWSPLALIRTNDKLDSRFAYYAFSSDYFQTQIKLFWSFGTQPNIGMNVLENLRVAVPGRNEQSLIVTYIESSIGNIDGTIDTVNKEINLLQEYRTALISEVVTGKVCVI